MEVSKNVLRLHIQMNSFTYLDVERPSCKIWNVVRRHSNHEIYKKTFHHISNFSSALSKVTLWQCSRLKFWKNSVKILALALAVLSENFYDFPQPLQAIAKEVAQLGHYCFLPNPFTFNVHITLLHPMLFHIV
jgi:hypothetical protein